MAYSDDPSGTDERQIRRLLVSTCVAEVDRELDLAVLARPGAWASFERQAQAHGVLGRVISELAACAGIDRLPAPVSAAISDGVRALRRRDALVDADIGAVTTALASKGVSAVLLKGAALRQDLYTDGVRRDLQDLDVLVSRDEISAAAGALRAIGYRLPSSLRRAKAYLASHFHLPVYRRGSLTVEIHWGLSSPRQGFRLDASRVREGAHSLNGGPVAGPRIPAVEHMVLHLVLQTVQEGWIRLGRLVDLDRVVRTHGDLDWERLRTEAHAGHLGPATWLALRVARRLLGTPVPEAALTAVRPSSVTALHLTLLRPVAAALSGCHRGRFTAQRIQEYWLLDRGDLRRALLARTFRYDTDGVEFLARPLGPVAGLIRLGKLAAFQVWLYMRAVSSIPRGAELD